MHNKTISNSNSVYTVIGSHWWHCTVEMSLQWDPHHSQGLWRVSVGFHHKLLKSILLRHWDILKLKIHLTAYTLPAKNKGDLLWISSIFWANRAFISRCSVPAARFRFSIPRGGKMVGRSRLVKLSQLLESLSDNLFMSFTDLVSLWLLP